MHLMHPPLKYYPMQLGELQAKPKQRSCLLYVLSKLMMEENIKFPILALLSAEQDLFDDKWALR